ncbi:putative adhesin/hemagglutinin/hemolysin domain protein, partial [Escherichia coli TW09195]
MKCQSLLMRFLVTVLIWFIAIFIMSVMMFFFIRVFAFYWIGGDFL